MEEVVAEDAGQDAGQVEMVSSSQTVQGTGGVEAPSWQYADGVGGEGQVPDWFLADKYRTVEDQAKAALELRKKLGSKAEDAPEHYELDYDKYGLSKEDPVLAEFNPFFKEMNLPQKDYEKIIEKFVQIQQKHHEQFEEQRKAAFDAFGPETKETMSRLNNWMANKFSEAEQQALQGFMTSAENIRIIEKMRGQAPKSAPPTAQQASAYAPSDSLATINQEIQRNWQKMTSDPGYRAMMEKKRFEAHQRERGRG